MQDDNEKEEEMKDCSDLFPGKDMKVTRMGNSKIKINGKYTIELLKSNLYE